MIQECHWLNARSDHACSPPHCNTVSRNVCNHNSIRANHSVASNDHRTKNFCTGSDIHTVSDRQHTILGRIAADGDALINVNIMAYLNFFMDDNAEATIPEGRRPANPCGDLQAK